jgi:hypothetical protein
LSGRAGLRKALGQRVRLGVVLYAGTQALALDGATIAVPFGAFLRRDGR